MQPKELFQLNEFFCLPLPYCRGFYGRPQRRFFLLSSQILRTVHRGASQSFLFCIVSRVEEVIWDENLILISYGFKYSEQESLLEIHPSSFNFKTAQIHSFSHGTLRQLHV